ncbi:MAG: 5'-methylthioadenosine phosphorylase [Alteromonadaceae bacterium]|nr:5'-methylthioadenosine phosphorylase [Alteromonadaceae bacterium]
MPIHSFLRNAALVAALATLPAAGALAQVIPEPVPDDYYRAELVILKRLVDPADVEEQMAGKKVEPPVSSARNLWVESEGGSRATDLKLLGRNQMHLGQSARRLENTGRYRVLAAAGWYQGFPPGEDTGPMRVALGDWLTAAGHREIEGTIGIERRRYLHVDVDLNHWQVTEEALAEAREQAEAEAARVMANNEASGEQTANATEATSGSDARQTELSTVPPTVDPELVTWIREVRRMRSGEIHFIDSPTLGVLVYFEPIEE